MSTATISKKITKGDDLIVLPRKEYEAMKARMIPEFYLKGNAAKRLDRRVVEGLRAHRQKKTDSIESFLKQEYPHLYKTYGR